MRLFDKVRQHIFFLCFLILCSCGWNRVAAQNKKESIAGRWTGTATQEPARPTALWNLTLELTQDGDIVKGTSRISNPNDPRTFAVFDLTGKVESSGPILQEGGIQQRANPSGWNWCPKTMLLITEEDMPSFVASVTISQPGRA